MTNDYVYKQPRIQPTIHDEGYYDCFRIDNEDKHVIGAYYNKIGKVAIMCPHCFDYSVVGITSNAQTTITIRDVEAEELYVNIGNTDEEGILHQSDLVVDVAPNILVDHCNWCGYNENGYLYKPLLIDVNLAPAVQTFNRRGYKTVACCDGDNNPNFYIMFKHSKNLERKLSDAIDKAQQDCVATKSTLGRYKNYIDIVQLEMDTIMLCVSDIREKVNHGMFGNDIDLPTAQLRIGEFFNLIASYMKIKKKKKRKLKDDNE